MLEHKGDTASHDPFRGQLLLLNLRRLIIALLKQLVDSLELAAMLAFNQIRQLMKARWEKRDMTQGMSRYFSRKQGTEHRLRYKMLEACF